VYIKIREMFMFAATHGDEPLALLSSCGEVVHSCPIEKGTLRDPNHCGRYFKCEEYHIVMVDKCTHWDTQIYDMTVGRCLPRLGFKHEEYFCQCNELNIDPPELWGSKNS
jgi:hypothetical protein